MIPTSEIKANHNREEVETRAGDNLFVDFPWRTVMLSPYDPKESHPTCLRSL
jgi:hypothetical protein